MKVVTSIGVLLVLFAAAVASSAAAQSAVATLALSADRIGEIKTAQGITTMIRFPDAVQEIICGDLYDPGTGKGTFVVQRSGPADHPGNEVFIKPVSVRGASRFSGLLWWTTVVSGFASFPSPASRETAVKAKSLSPLFCMV